MTQKQRLLPTGAWQRSFPVALSSVFDGHASVIRKVLGATAHRRK